MNDFFQKFINIENETSKAKGDFIFFGVLLRAESADKWDLVLSAPWLSIENKDDLKYFTEIIKKHLKNDIVKLSRVAVIKENNPVLKPLLSTINVEHGSSEFINANLFGMLISHAFIITAKNRKHIT